MMIRVTKTTPDVYLCPVCNKRVQTVDYEYTGDDTTLNIYNCHECSLLFARPFVIPEITQRQMDSVEDAELFTPIYKKLHKTFVLKKEIKKFLIKILNHCQSRNKGYFHNWIMQQRLMMETIENL